MESGPPARTSIAARLLGGGARGARAVAEATGIDDAVELATEEALVRALESPAVERAIIRVLEGPAAEEAVERLLASPAVERAVMNALDSKLVDHAWERLLQSEEAQMLVERIAEAPEVRAAITSQGVGLVEDLGRQIRRIAHRLDGAAESVARRLMRRPQRAERTDNAGLVTRALALALDAAVVNATFIGLSALFTFAVQAFEPDFDRSSAPALALGSVAFIGLVSAYLFFFWTLAGQTLGMRFLGIRLDDFDGTPALRPRSAFRRLVGIAVAVLPAGAGFLPVLVSDRRRGLHDRIGRTEVILVDRQGRPESAAHRENEGRLAPP
ncbi:hypothetical protein BH24ACT23_BH24ACT23_05600 [soil metagenome]